MSLIYLLHPISLFLASNITITLTAAFTDRRSRLRYVALLPLVFIAITLPWSMSTFVKTTGWIGRVPAGVTFWNIVTCFDRLIRRGWDHEHYGPTTTSNSNEAAAKLKDKDDTSGAIFSGSRMEFGSEVSSQARGIGLFWQVKNVPSFSEERPDMVPTRGAFILVHSISVIACYYLHNFAVEMSLSLDPHLVSMERVTLLTRLPEVTSTELQARVTSSLGYWVIQYSMMQFFYSAFALITAIFDPSDIYLWHPLFGSPRDAYSLRNFWG